MPTDRTSSLYNFLLDNGVPIPVSTEEEFLYSMQDKNKRESLYKFLTENKVPLPVNNVSDFHKAITPDKSLLDKVTGFFSGEGEKPKKTLRKPSKITLRSPNGSIEQFPTDLGEPLIKEGGWERVDYEPQPLTKLSKPVSSYELAGDIPQSTFSPSFGLQAAQPLSTFVAQDPVMQMAKSMARQNQENLDRDNFIIKNPDKFDKVKATEKKLEGESPKVRSAVMRNATTPQNLEPIETSQQRLETGGNTRFEELEGLLKEKDVEAKNYYETRIQPLLDELDFIEGQADESGALPETLYNRYQNLSQQLRSVAELKEVDGKTSILLPKEISEPYEQLLSEYKDIVSTQEAELKKTQPAYGLPPVKEGVQISGGQETYLTPYTGETEESKLSPSEIGRAQASLRMKELKAEAKEKGVDEQEYLRAHGIGDPKGEFWRGIKRFFMVEQQKMIGGTLQAIGTVKPRKGRHQLVGSGRDIALVYREGLSKEKAEELTKSNPIYHLGQKLNEVADKTLLAHSELWEPENMLEFDWGTWYNPSVVARAVSNGLPTLLESFGIAAGTTVLTGNPFAGLAAGAMYAGVLEGGSAFNTAKEYGLSDVEAQKSFAIVGGINAMLETLPLGGLLRKTGLNKKVQKELLEKVVERGLYKHTSKEAFDQGIREAVTETLQELNTVLDELGYMEVYDKTTIIPRIAESGYGGLILGIIGGGGAGANQVRKAHNVKSVVVRQAKEEGRATPLWVVEVYNKKNKVFDYAKFENEEDAVKLQERIAKFVDGVKEYNLEPDRAPQQPQETTEKEKAGEPPEPTTKGATTQEEVPEELEEEQKEIPDMPNTIELAGEDYANDYAIIVGEYSVTTLDEFKKAAFKYYGEDIWEYPTEHKDVFNVLVKDGVIKPKIEPEKMVEVPEKVYRVPTGFTQEGMAGDVIRYEQEELGNELGVSEEVIQELDKYPASQIRWFTRTKEQAERYGKEVEETELPAGSRIIADIGDEGILVFTPPQKPAAKVAEEPQEAVSPEIRVEVPIKEEKAPKEPFDISGEVQDQRTSPTDRATAERNRQAEEILSKAVEGVPVQEASEKEFIEELDKQGLQYSGQLGFYDSASNIIYINKDSANKDTIFHEFSHPVVNHIKKTNKKLYDQGLDLIKGTEYEANAKAQGYENFQDEALVQAIGEEGARILEEKQKNRFKVWLKRLMFSVKKTFNRVFKVSPTLSEFTSEIAYKMQTGKPFVGDIHVGGEKSLNRLSSRGSRYPKGETDQDYQNLREGIQLYERKKQISRNHFTKDTEKVDQHSTLAKMKKHTEYDKAKNQEDAIAGLKIAQDLIKSDRIEALHKELGDDVIVVPVLAIEKEGKNTIPFNMARHISELTGWEKSLDILQVNKVQHTKKDNLFRLYNQPVFDGKVIKGATYILVDDAVGSGITLANLKGYIESQGGMVKKIIVLGAGFGKQQLKPRDATLNKLKENYTGKELQEVLNFIYGKDTQKEHLTETEVRTLNGKRSEILDRIREEGTKGFLYRSGQQGKGVLKKPSRQVSKPRIQFAKAPQNQPSFISQMAQLYKELGEPTKLEFIRFLREGGYPQKTRESASKKFGFIKKAVGKAVEQEIVPTKPKKTLKPPVKPVQTGEEEIKPKRFLLKKETKTEAFKRIVQDINTRIRVVQKQLEAQGGTVTEESDVFLHKTLLPKLIGAKVKKIKETIEEPFIRDVIESGITTEELGEYLHAKHAPERNAMMEERGYEGDSGSGMTDEEAQAALQKHSDRSKIFETFANRIYKMLDNNLDYLVSEGLMKAEEAGKIREAYDYYVPLHRVIEEFETGIGTGKGVDIKGKEVKRAKGSERQVLPIIAQVFNKLERTIVRAEKNKVGIAFKELIDLNPDSKLWKIEAMKYIPRFNKEGELQFLDPKYKLADNVIGFKENGKQYFITVNDPLLARALKETGKSRGLALMRAPISLLSVLSTKYSPEFLYRNFMRDYGEGLINLGDVSDTHLTKDTMKGLRREVAKNTFSIIRGVSKNLKGKETKWADLIEDFEKSGGEVGYFWLEKEQSVMKRLQTLEKQLRNEGFEKVKNKVRVAGNFVGDMNRAIELGIRISSYNSLLKRGVSKKRAAAIAADLTVDFNKVGELGPWAKSLYLFINPQIQGTARMLKGMFRSKKVRRSAVGMFAGGFTVGMLSYLLGGDDDDDIPDYKKNTRLIFATPDGKEISLWFLPYGFNSFWAAGRYTSEFFTGRLTWDEVLLKSGLAALDSFNPLGGTNVSFTNLAPAVTKPLVENLLNENWAGYKIMPDQPQFNGSIPDHNRYWDSVTEQSKFIAKLLNDYTSFDNSPSGLIDISPESIDNAVSGYTGSVGRFLMNLGETVGSVAQGKPTKLNHIPFVRDFFSEIDRKRSKLNIVYETLDESRRKKIGGLRRKRFLNAVAFLEKEGHLDENEAEKYRNRFEKDQGYGDEWAMKLGAQRDNIRKMWYLAIIKKNLGPRFDEWYYRNLDNAIISASLHKRFVEKHPEYALSPMRVKVAKRRVQAYY